MNQQLQDLIQNIYIEMKEGKIVRDGKLYTERELCEHFSVKRGVMQKALVSLEALGFIESKERLGTVVVDKQKELLSDTLPFITGRSPLAINNQAFDARLVVEPRVAYIAAEKCNKEQAFLLEKEMQFLDELYVDTSRPQQEKAELFHQHNIIFHNMIFDIVDNMVLNEINAYLSKLSRDVFALFGRLPSGFQPYAVWPIPLINEHKAIEKAIIENNPARAEEMMTVHLINSKQRNSAKISGDNQ